MSYQGKFRPSNTKKYRGNPTNIIYRSLWERKFMVYCDRNESILEWGSEEIVIPYKSPIDNKWHRYFPDFYIKYQDSRGKIKRSIIEIKPFKQTQQPPLQEKKTKSYVYEVTQYVTNQAKWAAAEEFCKDRLWEFKIFTEKELGIK
jgi:hypothetical protein